MGRTSKEMWKTAGLWALRLIAILLIAGTLLSITDLNQWWIRIWDFPRMQILMAMAMAGTALWFLDRDWRPWIPVILAGLGIWQIYRIHPYTSIARPEVAQALLTETDDINCFTVLTLNVLQTNRQYERTAELIDGIDPDILLLTETDQAWADAMAPALKNYPDKIHRPLDNTYGIMFATRLPVKKVTIQDVAEEDTPSVFATLMAGRREFRLIGLHPRPPTPNQDTEERDAEIIMAARQSRNFNMPTLAIGDFNDVGWSDTTELFKNIGSFLDPRIGRGTFATFPADMIWLGWPLDHLFVTEEFLLKDFSVGKPVGSDHRAIIAQLCLDPATARSRNEDPEGPSAAVEQEEKEVMKEFEEDAAEDRVEGDAG